MTSPINKSDSRDHSIHWLDIDEQDVEEAAENAATPAIPATPAVPASSDGTPATRAVKATPATPAVPAHDVTNATIDTQTETDVQEETAKVNRRRSGLRRAESANGQLNFGQVTKSQWELVHQFKNGRITADDLRTQFMADEKSKLDAMVQDNKISADEETRRLARFSTLVDKLITNFS